MRSNEEKRTVASRIFAIFEAFEDHGRSQSLSQLSQVTGLPISTTHRIVNELCSWGALTRDSQGRYQIGIRLWELAQNAGRRLRDTARPFLQDLFSLTGETAHLAVREGNEALYVDRIYGSKRVPRASRIGGRLPLHATGVGKVLLAYEEPWFREAYLNGVLTSLTEFTHVDAERLTIELAVIAERGYAIAGEEARVGACSIAVPVSFGAEAASVPGAVEAAIGIVALSTEMPTLTRHLPVLKGVARRIESNIQHRARATIQHRAFP